MEMKPSVWTNILVFMLTAEAQIVKLSRYVTLTILYVFWFCTI